ncbi:MAG TPA: ankyrin repeat domain-containing protein, partial [Candidatus Berkiella sp.]|nr:ankyrin repeat domain-containing protein [Candidatus Berkiella sp.]
MAITKSMRLLTKKLISHYPKLIHEFDKYQQAVFHHAVNFYDPDIMQMLITVAPELINHQRQDGKTALHLAVNTQNELAIRQLVLTKANIYIAD